MLEFVAARVRRFAGPARATVPVRVAATAWCLWALGGLLSLVVWDGLLAMPQAVQSLPGVAAAVGLLGHGGLLAATSVGCLLGGVVNYALFTRDARRWRVAAWSMLVFAGWQVVSMSFSAWMLLQLRGY